MIWLFRENLTNKGNIHLIWDELQRQLNEQGYLRNEVRFRMHCSSHPNPVMPMSIHLGEIPQRPDKAGMEHGSEKGKKSKFGYKLHSLIDKEYQFVRRFDTSPASLHDSHIDLSQKGETVDPDKGYFGTIPYASIDKTMKR